MIDYEILRNYIDERIKDCLTVWITDTHFNCPEGRKDLVIELHWNTEKFSETSIEITD